MYSPDEFQHGISALRDAIASGDPVRLRSVIKVLEGDIAPLSFSAATDLHRYLYCALWFGDPIDPAEVDRLHIDVMAAYGTGYSVIASRQAPIVERYQLDRANRSKYAKPGADANSLVADLRHAAIKQWVDKHLAKAKYARNPSARGLAGRLLSSGSGMEWPSDLSPLKLDAVRRVISEHLKTIK